MSVQQCRKTKVESLEIPFQQCVKQCDKHDHTKSFYFGFNQTIQPNKFVGDDVHRNVPVTNGQLESWQAVKNMAAYCWKLLRGPYGNRNKIVGDKE